MAHERKADRVARDLLSRIVSGELAVGDLLPKEAELAARFHVNRSVIREAIKLLEVHRLVHPVKRRGTEVLDPLSSLSPEVLQAMLAPRPGVVDTRVLRDFLEIRAQLDEQMTRLAAERRTDADLARMDVCLEELQEHLYDPHRYQQIMGELALAVARATQNRLFVMLVHWHRRVQAELENVFLAARPTNELHLQGLSLMIQLIRDREAEPARALVAAFHEWAIPRHLAAAALATGEPLSNLMEVVTNESR